MHEARTAELAASFARHLLADEVELRAAHTCALDELDAIDHRRVDREDLLDADTGSDLADREGSADLIAVLTSKDKALECLEAGLTLFLDLLPHAHRISRFELRDLGASLCLSRCHSGGTVPQARNMSNCALLSHPALPLRILGKDRVEGLFAEIRPVRLKKEKLAVGRLPEEEIRNTLRPTGSDDDIRIGHLCGP